MGKSIHEIIIEGIEYNSGYKVVTENLESLGLRKNPNIIKYTINEWYNLSEEQIEKGNGDWGGIWVCRILGGARKIKKYMKDKYGKDTIIFKTGIDEILFYNNYRIKTNGVILLEELSD